MAASEHPTSGSRSGAALTAFRSIVGVASLVVLLQAVWAGLFVHEGEDYTASWVEVHARGADLAILLAVVATVVGAWGLRERRDLWIGSGVFAALLVLEAYIGGLIGGHGGLTVVHFPLGMALMAISVWLPMRAARPS